MLSKPSSHDRIFVSIRVAGALYEPELFAMCDYSLHGVATRPARVGDKLVTTQFWNTTTRGFSAMDEPRVAVCLLPGTEIAFKNKVERHLTAFQVLFKKGRPLPHQVARFQQVNMDKPCTHHDALEFPDGQVVLLTHLREGQRAVVLQLPAQAKKAEAEHLPEARAVDRLHDPQAGALPQQTSRQRARSSNNLPAGS